MKKVMKDSEVDLQYTEKLHEFHNNFYLSTNAY